nr:immunoglobulin light chain junction region [Macaca mulatta]MOV85149.1 immunoglobulin light chain junction region [Macaca mulatta]
CQQYDNDPFTF